MRDDVIGETEGSQMRLDPPRLAERTGFDALFDDYYERAVRLASLTGAGTGSDPQDVAADALARVWLKWRARAVDDFWPYLRVAVVNAARSAERHRRVVERHARATPPADAAPAAEPVIVEREAVAAALARLPNRQRCALVLRYFEDLSLEECARVMRCSVGTAKSTTARGLAALRIVMGEQSDDPDR